MSRKNMEVGFLRAICANPQDDSPRLIFADWLEEHGQPERAEFIRTQIALASGKEGSEPLSEVRREWLHGRELALLRRHEHEWRRGAWARSPDEIGVRSIGFRRGMPEDISLDAQRFPAVADELFSVAPISSLRLTPGRNGQRDMLSTRPLCDDADIQAVASCRHLLRLTALHITGLTTQGAQMLASSSYLGKLTTLKLTDGSIGPRGAEALASSSRNCPLLRTISLSNNRIGDWGVEAFAGAAHWQGLTTLELAQNEIGNAGVRFLADSNRFPNLANLDLSRNELADQGVSGGAGIETLAASPHFAKLKYLSLQGNRLGPGSIEAMAGASSQLRHLTMLDLGENNIQNRGAQALAGSPLFGSLTGLRLWDNNIGPEGAEALASSPHPCQLVGLDLAGNPIQDGGAAALARSANCRSLTSLELGRCEITAIGAKALADSVNLGNLAYLDLGGNSIGAEGARELRDSKTLTGLTDLSVWPRDIGRRLHAEINRILDGRRTLLHDSARSQPRR